MYDVVVYDEDVGQFVPVRNPQGKALSYESWSGASDVAFGLTLRDPSKAYKVEYRTVRRKKGRK